MQRTRSETAESLGMRPRAVTLVTREPVTRITTDRRDPRMKRSRDVFARIATPPRSTPKFPSPPTTAIPLNASRKIQRHAIAVNQRRARRRLADAPQHSQHPLNGRSPWRGARRSERCARQSPDDRQTPPRTSPRSESPTPNAHAPTPRDASSRPIPQERGKDGGKATAAAVTGPAHGPRPASSTPIA